MANNIRLRDSNGIVRNLDISGGGTGADTVAGALTNLGIKDHVVDAGTVAHGGGLGGSWHYRKWNSGVAECWGTFTFTASSYTQLNTWYGYYVDVTYPSGLFNAVPSPTFSGSISTQWAIPNTILNHTKTSGRYFLMCPSGGNQSCEIRIHAFGTWA